MVSGILKAKVIDSKVHTPELEVEGLFYALHSLTAKEIARVECKHELIQRTARRTMTNAQSVWEVPFL